MKPATTYPARRDDVRLLVVDPASGTLATQRMADLPGRLAPGDLLVVNDAATLPASLRGRDERGRPVEARLCAPGDAVAGVFPAVLFGAGDWRQRTEDRPPPPALAPGAWLTFGALGARVRAVSPLSARLVELSFELTGDDLWAALYREGRPVQYSYLAHDLPLWAVQTVYAGRPWASEMPSAGRPLSWQLLLALRRAGVRLATLTHAAGLSATGDPALDRALPLPERFDVPPATARAVGVTRRGGGRVIAVGTTVVRALEGAVAASPAGQLRAGAGETSLRLGPGHRPAIVDGLLTGVHVPGESHFALLEAFADGQLLRRAAARAEAEGFLTHELGDSLLVLPGAEALARSPVPASSAARTL
jgi:S-adenosylmethionine:tRNA ribosyltransferase-isomerase